MEMNKEYHDYISEEYSDTMKEFMDTNKDLSGFGIDLSKNWDCEWLTNKCWIPSEWGKGMKDVGNAMTSDEFYGIYVALKEISEKISAMAESAKYLAKIKGELDEAVIVEDDEE